VVYGASLNFLLATLLDFRPGGIVERLLSYESPEPVSESHFRICQNCGRLTPAQLPECAHCGARALHSVAEVMQARGEERFIRAFLARATPVTYAIFIFNLTLYVLIAALPGRNFLVGLIAPANTLTLLAVGAKTNYLLFQGDYFRLVTPIFIHIGLLHLAMNSYALWIIGPQVEKLYGSARFAVLYLLSGIGGVAGSVIGVVFFQRPDVPGAGASGALFGLFGVLLVFGFRHRHEIPGVFRRATGAGVAPVILLNLVIGFAFPFIDNAAHIGGLITGAILALLIPFIRPGEERVSRGGLAMLAACVFIVAWSFARAYLQSGKYLPRKNPTQVTSVHSTFNPTLSGGL
jgi:membrane associated rhomboid family serine protease